MANLQRDNATNHEQGRKHMNLKFSATMPVMEPSADGGFIIKYQVQLVTGKSDEVIAEAEIQRLLNSLSINEGESLYDICDADSGEWEEFYSTFLDEEEDEFREELGIESSHTDDFLMFCDIKAVEGYKGRGIESLMWQMCIDSLGSGCSIAAFYLGEHVEEAEYFKDMGLRQAGRFLYWEVELAQPRLILDSKSLEECRFAVHPDYVKAVAERSQRG